MEQALTATFRISLLIFMVGSLSGLGLELALRDAVRPLRNARFVILVLLWGFVLSPFLAWFLARALSLEPGYAVGLLLLGMTPCAPFVPLVVRRARGDLAYTAALTLLTALGTVLFMPFAVPRMIDGLDADVWTIGRPLLLFVLAPLSLGLAIRAASPAAAARIAPPLRKLVSLATIVLLISMVLIHRNAFASALGSTALAAQLLFLGVVTAASYGLAFGLRPEQKSVLSLGICTRNLGAAFAAATTAANPDPKVLVMLVLGVPTTVGISVAAAAYYSRRGTTNSEAKIP